MKYIRALVLAAFVIALGGYFFLSIRDQKTKDSVPPTITCGTDTITVSVEDEEDKLLEGLTASDDRDGDLSDAIAVESIGPFLSDMTRQVTYVVCDSSNNVARCTRTLSYSDYTSPRFSLDSALRFTESDTVNIMDYLSAEDVLDGDLTRNIQLADGYMYNNPDPGKYCLKYHVSNSAGDTSYIELVVDVATDDNKYTTPYVNLSEYIVYLNAGKSFNPYQYIENVTVGNRTFALIQSSDEESAKEGKKCKGLFGDLSNKEADDDLISSVEYGDIYVDNEVDRKTPGVYTVTYSITSQDGFTGTTGLSVIVY